MSDFKTFDDLPEDLTGKKVLVRVDLNVPMDGAKVTDDTRLRAMLPTVLELSDRGAIVLLLSHFGRPKGEVRPDMSTAQLVLPIHRLAGRSVRFIEDCQGPEAERAITTMLPGNIGVLENTRFHLGEEKNDPELAKAMAALGDFYVDDSFSTAHRAHASTEGITHFLPSYAGRAMEAELKALERALGNPERPVAAVVGGAKVSTKLAVLGHLVGKVDHLIIGGGMANTFLAARGVNVGKSLCEHELTGEAESIFERAEAAGCTIHLPYDVVVAKEFAPNPPSMRTCNVHEVAARRDDPRHRPGRGRGAGRRAQDLPDVGLERAARRVRNAAVRRRDRRAGEDRGGADQGRLAGFGRGRRRYGRRAQPRRRRAGFHLRLDRRRSVSRMDGRAYAAGRRRVGTTGVSMNQSDMTAKIEQGRRLYRRARPVGRVHAQGAAGLWHRGGRVGQRRGDVRPHPPDARRGSSPRPASASGKVIGAILFERTMDGSVDGKPTPQALIDRGIVPFIKIDKGLEDEENGVQMMKPMPGLDALLERAKALGVFGTKERSVINPANPAGIAVAGRAAVPGRASRCSRTA